jgi:hypothetical protein
MSWSRAILLGRGNRELSPKNYRGRLLCCYGLSTSIRFSFTTVGYVARRVSISSGLDSV